MVQEKYTSKEGLGWFTKRNTLDRFNIGRRRLDDWASRGWVRTAKLDDSPQGRRLYCIADLDRVLATKAKGREPKWGVAR